MSEQEAEIVESAEGQVQDSPKSPLARFRRLGCGLMLIIWFGILLIPGVMFWLATGGQIRIPHGDIPDPHQHPLFQVDLVMTVENRGLQFMQSSIHKLDEQNICVQTDVNYLLWQSDDTATDATYCQCYERADTESTWTFTTQATDACES